MNINAAQMVRSAANHQKLVAWVEDESAASRIREVTDGISNLACDIAVVAAPLAEASAKPSGSADIGLIEISELDESRLKIIEGIAKDWGDGACLIVMLSDPTAETINRLARVGIEHVLPISVTVEELRPALMQAAANDYSKKTASGRGHVVTVLKTAGGCGASLLATNLAAEFSRQTGTPVALVDLDIHYGSLALYLDLRPQHTLLDAMQAEDRLDRTMLRSLVEKHSSGVDLLAAPRSMVPLDCVSDDFLERLFGLLKQTYPLTVVELPTGWSDWFAGVFEETDQAVAVCEPSVRSAAGLTKIMQSLGDMYFENLPFCVIANKVRSDFDTKGRVGQLSTTLGRPVETVAFDDRAAERAVNAGLLLSQTGRKSKCYRDVQVVAGRLLDALGHDRDEQAQSSVGGGFVRLLGRRRA